MSFFHESPQPASRRPAKGVALAIAVLVGAPSLMALDAPNRPAGVHTRAIASRTAPSQSKGHTPALYLAMIGPTPLRFANPATALPPEPVMPKPIVAVDGVPATTDPTHSPRPGVDAATGSSGATDQPQPDSSTEATGGDAAGKTPLRIIPDDTRNDVRPEDVLPFFQLPAGADGVGLDLPLALPGARTPAAQPVSRATYRQQ